MEEFEVINTQNKIYNNKRRTYIDHTDCKEGEAICRKCLGVGEILPKEEHFGVQNCPKCQGRGIVDWVEQVVGKPILITDSSASVSSTSGTSSAGSSGVVSSWSMKKDPKYVPLKKMIESTYKKIKKDIKLRR